MKIISIIVVIFSLFGYGHNQSTKRNPRCDLPGGTAGLCRRGINGYLYLPIRNACQKYLSEGCTTVGRFFSSREDCDKCRK
ncbi:hypothetical protein M5D96_003578 [Drosophila gunungcola]|uniref:BPTI/Kunitz inhibitor domain-containing protein n=1 Tax=Drosophila gunungcola TaxID=103775 RepID=A0A9Q0BS86_9MUSC|nr:hypothetical protein M5D96_003578 [Drosophila gunungcola]